MTTSGRRLGRRARVRAALVGVGLCAVGTSAALVATASGSPMRDAGTSTSAAAGTLVVNTAQAPATVDPGAGCLAPEVGFIANFYARLTQFGTKAGPDGTKQVDTSVIKPWLAKSWKISKNGLTYTFKLRSGLKFPSGKPVNAAAVKFSWDRSITMGLLRLGVHPGQPLHAAGDQERRGTRRADRRPAPERPEPEHAAGRGHARRRHRRPGRRERPRRRPEGQGQHLDVQPRRRLRPVPAAELHAQQAGRAGGEPDVLREAGVARRSSSTSSAPTRRCCCRPARARRT